MAVSPQGALNSTRGVRVNQNLASSETWWVKQSPLNSPPALPTAAKMPSSLLPPLASLDGHLIGLASQFAPKAQLR